MNPHSLPSNVEIVHPVGSQPTVSFIEPELAAAISNIPSFGANIASGSQTNDNETTTNENIIQHNVTNNATTSTKFLEADEAFEGEPGKDCYIIEAIRESVDEPPIEEQINEPPIEEQMNDINGVDAAERIAPAAIPDNGKIFQSF